MRPVQTDGTEKRWTVWVGGTEVIYYVTDFNTARDIADDYLEDQYDDIVIQQYDTGEEIRVC